MSDIGVISYTIPCRQENCLEALHLEFVIEEGQDVPSEELRMGVIQNQWVLRMKNDTFDVAYSELDMSENSLDVEQTIVDPSYGDWDNDSCYCSYQCYEMALAQELAELAATPPEKKG